MPKTVTVLSVFVASPGDVADERSLVKDVIDEINSMIESLHLRLEFVGWEQDVIPELGADPQAIINDQIGDDYDIFIGILWTRFGTPTPRASSGTKEEFDRAYQRFLQAPADLRMMLYFSECLTNPAKLDLEQVRLVQEFRMEVGDEGVYSTYNTLDEFQSLVRLHLSRIAQEWGKIQRSGDDTFSQVTPVHAAVDSAPSNDDSSEPNEGLLDLIVRGSDAMAAWTETIDRMGKTVQHLVDSLNTRTAELNAVSKSDTRLVKRFVDRAASDLLSFADEIHDEIPRFVEGYGTALDAFGRSAVLLPEIGPSDVEPIRQSRDTLHLVIEGMESGKKSVEELRQGVGSLPPMSTNLNKAKVRAVSTLDSLAAEWARAIDASREVEGLYQLALEDLADQAESSG